MEVQSLAALGLTLDLVGVGILFLYGPPQPVLEEGIGVGLEDGTPIDPDGKTVAEHKKEVRRRRWRFLTRSRFGLGLIFVGFALQLYDSIC